jgi:periplasmic copper chaperone A
LAFWAAFAIAGYSGVACAGPTAPITVDRPFFRFLLPILPAAGYMTLRNTTGHPAVLTAAHSEACGNMMLHQSVSQNGQDTMVDIENVVIPAHGSFTFRPGAYHVMCTQPNMKPGQLVAVALKFEHLPPLTVEFKVYGATGSPSLK